MRLYLNFSKCRSAEDFFHLWYNVNFCCWKLDSISAILSTQYSVRIIIFIETIILTCLYFTIKRKYVVITSISSVIVGAYEPTTLCISWELVAVPGISLRGQNETIRAIPWCFWLNNFQRKSGAHCHNPDQFYPL